MRYFVFILFLFLGVLLWTQQSHAQGTLQLQFVQWDNRVQAREFALPDFMAEAQHDDFLLRQTLIRNADVISGIDPKAIKEVIVNQVGQPNLFSDLMERTLGLMRRATLVPLRFGIGVSSGLIGNKVAAELNAEETAHLANANEIERTWRQIEESFGKIAAEVRHFDIVDPSTFTNEMMLAVVGYGVPLGALQMFNRQMQVWFAAEGWLERWARSIPRLNNERFLEICYLIDQYRKSFIIEWGFMTIANSAVELWSSNPSGGFFEFFSRVFLSASLFSLGQSLIEPAEANRVMRKLSRATGAWGRAAIQFISDFRILSLSFVVTTNQAMANQDAMTIPTAIAAMLAAMGVRMYYKSRDGSVRRWFFNGLAWVPGLRHLREESPRTVRLRSEKIWREKMKGGALGKCRALYGI